MNLKTKRLGKDCHPAAEPVIKTHGDETMNLHRNTTPEAGNPANDEAASDIKPGTHDPLLSAIRVYQFGIDEFNRAVTGVLDSQWDALAEATYTPHLMVLADWDQPATTMESAVEALRISLVEERGVYGCAAAEAMAKAALGYLEAAR